MFYLLGLIWNLPEVVLRSFELLLKLVRYVENKVVTKSLGAAQIVDGETVDSWMWRSDKALYKAKQTG